MGVTTTHSLALPLNQTKLPYYYSHSSELVTILANKYSFTFSGVKLQCLDMKGGMQHWRKAIVYASSSVVNEESTSRNDGEERWLLQPVGDGDSRHIGYRVPLPDTYEISASEVTVGRVPEKADLVIPVATVSAVHARIQMKEGSLVVTDMNSTNGTFIDDKRLSPGVPATISPGRLLTFGDTNLAIFRVLKVQKVLEELVKSEVDDATTDTDVASNKSQSQE